MSKKNAQKVKDREKKVREKLLKHRNWLRKQAKVEREERLSQREAQKIDNRVNGRTIVNRSPEDQHALLQRNLDILKALEDQQAFLEQERLRNPPAQVTEQHERARGIKQTAGVQFIPNPETNEPLLAPVEPVLVEGEVDFTPNLSDTPSLMEQHNSLMSQAFDNAALDPAAARLAEKLEALSKKRTMGTKK